MSVTDKHMEAARAVFEAKLDAMCLTWDHSFGTMDEDCREGLRRCFRQIGHHDIIPAFAAALATAEREGMKRAAEIARGHVYHERYRTWPWWNGGNRRDDSDIVQHSDAIAKAILSEAERTA